MQQGEGIGPFQHLMNVNKMKKYIAGILLTSFTVTGAIYFFYSNTITSEFCIPNSKKCITVKGKWTLPTQFAGKESLLIVSTPFFSKKNRKTLDIYFPAGEFGGLLERKDALIDYKSYDWGRVMQFNLKNEAVKNFNSSGFFEGKFYVKDKHVVLSCNNNNCLNDIVSIHNPKLTK